MNERIRARKSLGQNFLIDPNIQRNIVGALEPAAQDTVVEIGPGTGALTQHLVGQVAQVIAIELDDRLAERLQQTYGARPDFTLVRQDVMRVDFAQLALPAGFKVIGNIPYNITTPIIFHLLKRGTRPSVMILMVQKEVATRVTAAPGSKEYGALSVGVQSVARSERLFTVGRNAFRPVPNVDSAILRIVPHEPPHLQADEERDLRQLTRTVFNQRRKQLQNVLRHAPEYALDEGDVAQLEQATGLDLADRPEQLAPEQFIALARALRTAGWPKRSAA